MEVTIRDEQAGDVIAVRQLNEVAFGQPREARLVDLLRGRGGILLSLVAVVDGRVIGHILFSPVRIQASHGEVSGAGLGPMAVLPGFQRKGIGSKLVARGTGRLRANGCPFIVVLGHPEYYPRFGFVAAGRHGLRCQWEVPEEAFMVLPLDPSRLGAIQGEVRYRDEFATVT